VHKLGNYLIVGHINQYCYLLLLLQLLSVWYALVVLHFQWFAVTQVGTQRMCRLRQQDHCSGQRRGNRREDVQVDM